MGLRRREASATRGKPWYEPDAHIPSRRVRDFSLHGLGDQAWLLDRRDQRLFQLSSSAALIWSGYLDGLSRAEIARSLALRCGLSRLTAGAHVASALAPLTSQDGRRGNVAQSDQPRAEPLQSWPSLSEHRRDYCLLDFRFRLSYETKALFRLIDPLLDAAAVDETSEQFPEFAVVERAGGYAIRSVERVLGTCARLAELAPMVKSALAVAALQNSGDAYAVHAAALRKGGRCVLMPGRSGAGKSTLAAALNGRGWELVADDTAVVTRDILAVRQLPLPLCLKQGAWPLLSRCFPALEDAPRHLRADGKIVRYLPPRSPADGGMTRDPAPLGWIVFPTFVPNGRTQLFPLDAAEALKRLVAQLCPLGVGLDKDSIETLVSEIDRTPCYELQNSNLEGAVDLVQKACA